MIQRIQSLFLLLASGAAFSLLSFPFATADASMENSQLLQDGLYNIHDSMALLVIFMLAGTLTFVAIFLFRNRKNQLILCRIALMAHIIGLVMVVLFFLNDTAQQSMATLEDGAGLYMPLLSLLFTFLAIYYIRKDEKVVRSMDRLR